MLSQQNKEVQYLMKLKIFTDGGSRGNPGEAAVGCVILNDEDGTRLAELSERIGIATNNVAEYMAVVTALKWVKREVGNASIEFVVDSELIGKQLRGEYKVKDSNLKTIYLEAKELISAVGGVSNFTIVRREKNTEADALVNKALDA